MLFSAFLMGPRKVQCVMLSNSQDQPSRLTCQYYVSHRTILINARVRCNSWLTDTALLVVHRKRCVIKLKRYRQLHLQKLGSPTFISNLPLELLQSIFFTVVPSLDIFPLDRTAPALLDSCHPCLQSLACCSAKLFLTLDPDQVRPTPVQWEKGDRSFPGMHIKHHLSISLSLSGIF